MRITPQPAALRISVQQAYLLQFIQGALVDDDQGRTR